MLSLPVAWSIHAGAKTAIVLPRSCSAAKKTIWGRMETLHFSCNNVSRVGMLEVDNLTVANTQKQGPNKYNMALKRSLMYSWGLPISSY